MGADRLKEVDEAFAIRQNNLYPPQHWLLVDDVITTEATIVSCGKPFWRIVEVASVLYRLPVGCLENIALLSPQKIGMINREVLFVL